MIFITGDTHSNIDVAKLTTREFTIQSQLTREDYVIICGDFGCVWDAGKHDRYWLNWHENKNYTTLFVDGNHENFNLLENYPVKEWNGGRIHELRPHVYHLMRGQVFTLDNKTFFTMGGASSTDKHTRKEDILWWSREEIDEEDIAEANFNLSRVNNQVDYIITHTVSTSFKRKVLDPSLLLYPNSSAVEDYLDKVYDTVDYKYWFNGHFHIDRNYTSEKQYCLLNRVIALDHDGFTI